MATSDNRRNKNSNVSVELDEKDILTIEGYNKLFENCENTSDVFSTQASLFKIFDPSDWWRKLELWKLNLSVKCLFHLRNQLFQDEKYMQHNDYVTLIQFFSLLENVFRNVLLRPYVPAYRTINKDCGRYRSFIEKYEKQMPFKELQFESSSQNLLTYTGIDQTTTILYALTCNILSHYFIIQLENFDKDVKRQQQRQN